MANDLRWTSHGYEVELADTGAQGRGWWLDDDSTVPLKIYTLSGQELAIRVPAQALMAHIILAMRAQTTYQVDQEVLRLGFLVACTDPRMDTQMRNPLRFQMDDMSYRVVEHPVLVERRNAGHLNCFQLMLATTPMERPASSPFRLALTPEHGDSDLEVEAPSTANSLNTYSD